MIDALIGFFIATLITALFTARLFKLYWWYALNSLILGIIAIDIGIDLNDNAMILTGIVTILLKFITIPYVFKILTTKFNIARQITPKITIQYATIIVPMVLVFTFYLMNPILKEFSHTSYVSIAISSLFLSLLLIMQHTEMAPKIMGFLSLENSLFLLGITATNGMPMLIELGIFFDLLMFIVIINLLFEHQEELQ